MGIVEKFAVLAYSKLHAEESYAPDELIRGLAAAGIVIPDDYREFLMAFPETGMFDIEVVMPGGPRWGFIPHGEYPVSLFYARDDVGDNDLLRLRSIDWELGKGYLAIGSSCNYSYCMDLGGEFFGRISYFEHDALPDPVHHIVAGSFTEFVGRFEPRED